MTLTASFIPALDKSTAAIFAFALHNAQTLLVVFNKKETEQSFQVEADGKFLGYAASGHSITTFVW